MIRPMPLSKCEICQNLPNFRRANLMNGEALKGIERLIGMEEFIPTPTMGTGGLVRCPMCGTGYEYSVETGSFEHDEALRRLPPHEGWRNAPPEVLEKLYEALTVDLEAPNGDIREYAAGALMVHFTKTGQIQKGIALLGTSDEKVQIGALYAFIRWKLDVFPFIDRIIDHLSAPAGKVRDAASTYFSSRYEAGVMLEKHLNQLLETISSHPLGYTSLGVLNEMVKGDLPLHPVIPHLIRFANGSIPDDSERERAVCILKMAAQKSPEAQLTALKILGEIGPLHSSLEALKRELGDSRTAKKPAPKKKNRKGEK